jgi:phosphoribosylaminoimidazolecarboxamide formyltransferase/IMP cyclohydrolase
MKRILISVTDKRKLEKFKKLTDIGWEIISTGGTLAKLKELGIPCILVEEVTNFPEMMNGRVKTLHPNIFAGILADRSNPEHMATIAEHNILPIDMVVINLYDFEGNPGIEQIDIGGPSGLRAAAKNGLSVIPIVNPSDYDKIIDAIVKNGDVDLVTREKLVMKVFKHTYRYDKSIYEWMVGKSLRGRNFLK